MYNVQCTSKNAYIHHASIFSRISELTAPAINYDDYAKYPMSKDMLKGMTCDAILREGKYQGT